MSAAFRLSVFSAVLCLLLAGPSTRAELITIDLPELTGTFVHGQAPISATVDFGEVDGALTALWVVITATGTPGFSDTYGEVPPELVVSALNGDYQFIRPTVLGPFGATSTTLEVMNMIGTLNGDLAGSTTGGNREVHVTFDTNDIYSNIVTSPFVEISSVTVTAGFEPTPDCGWMGCDGFVGISELNLVLGNWNTNVTPGEWQMGDISGDGFVGIEDLNVVLGNWNSGTPPDVDDGCFNIGGCDNGFIGICELNLVLSNWNMDVPPGNPSADYNGDGFIGIEDLNVVLGNWNTGTPPTTSVPEPATLFCFGALSLLPLARRR